MSSGHTKDPSRVISGLKASIHNPNVSEEAKDRARHRLADLGDTKDLGHVISGLKASIHNPNVSEEAKDRARHRLADLANTSDASKEDRPVVEEFKLVEEVELVEQDVAEDEGGEKSVHQLGGFKATMHNPRTSKAAKDHAKQVLEQNDAL